MPCGATTVLPAKDGDGAWDSVAKWKRMLAVDVEWSYGAVSRRSRTSVPSALDQNTIGLEVLWLVVTPHGPWSSPRTPWELG